MFKRSMMPATDLRPAAVESRPIAVQAAHDHAHAALKISLMRSILLTKQMRGTVYSLACRHTVSDCGSTPATPSNNDAAI
jgi:hypothetical protein